MIGAMRADYRQTIAAMRKAIAARKGWKLVLEAVAP